jgi:hypothetical protein
MPFDSLEYVVRPYTTPNAHGQIIIPSTPRGTHARATLTWDGQMTIPTRTEVSDGVNFEVVCCQESLSEVSRKSKPERIYQNGDVNSSNWADIERPTSLRLKKKENNTCGDDWDQISGVAQEVNSVLAEWEADMNSGTTARPKNCSTSWQFKNE